MSTGRELAIAGSFSIDAVLQADGRWVIGKTGGNALWSTLGAAICGLKPRVLTVVGRDYPTEVIERLNALGVDTSAVRHIDRSHPVRVTFAHLPDGSRIQPVPAEMIAALPEDVRAAFADTTLQPDVLPLGAPTAEDVPSAWLDEIGYWHLPLLPLARHQALVARLADRRGHLQTDCPARSDLIGDPFARLAPTLGGIDVFLPSTSDFDVVAPRLSPFEIVARLREAGATGVVLKAGGDGVYVLEDDALWRIPAFPAEPLDPTGAGDAFCGGFLAGLALTADPMEAAALGSAAASFAVATEDPLTLSEVDPDDTLSRAVQLRKQAVCVGAAPDMRASFSGPPPQGASVVNE